MTIGCLSVRRQLGPFVDGELRGAQMLLVAQHLDDCTECAADVRAMRTTGDVLRRGAQELWGTGDLSGLAGSVVGRIGAESAQSWRVRLKNAGQDWHWPIVAAGSLAATCLSTALVSVILAFGPGPERDDSLAALMSDLNAPPSPLLVLASSATSGDEAVWMQLENGWPDAGPLPSGWGSLSAYQTPTEAELVSELAETVTRRGRVRTLETMRVADRPRVEYLLDDLTSRQDVRPASVSQTANVHEMRLLAAIRVRATEPR